MSVTVAQLKLGQKGIIKDFSGDALPIKLLEMGCLPGNEIEMVQIAPFKDPIYINVNGSHIAIRRAIAQQIEIDLIDSQL